jgi:hypothetical protein
MIGPAARIRYSAKMRKPLISIVFLLCLPLLAQKQEPGPLSKTAPMPVSIETRTAVQKIIGDTLVNG